MRKFAISYAIIRFCPHVETQEFANIGIVIFSPSERLIDFRLDASRIGRITHFFDNIEPATVRSILGSYKSELERVRHLAITAKREQLNFSFHTIASAEHLFASLTKEREGLIQFSDIRFLMTSDASRSLNDLYEYYVKRSFSNPIQREKIIERHIRHILKTREMEKYFRKETFTDGVYAATFPFVRSDGRGDGLALKPLYLSQADPTRILDHGNKWLFTIERLGSKMPGDIVFAVEGPEEEGPQRQAFEEIVGQLTDKGVTVVGSLNERDIVKAIQ